MHTPATDLDFVAGILVFIILTASALTLFGMAILMAAGAVTSNRQFVTSWPQDQEHAFAPFERRGSLVSSRAWAISLISALAVTVFTIGVYFGVTPDKKDVAKDMNMSNLTKKHTSAAPKPDAAPPAAAAPKPDTAAPAPDTAAPAPEAAPKE
jgi:hypothetical protein